MKNKRALQGFTLVELTMAIAFIAFMLLFATNVVIQITRLYSKGTAIRQISQAGRQVIGDLGTTLRYSSPVYIETQNRLCAGGVTYVWNIDGESVINKYVAPDSSIALRFISVQDPTGSLCVPPYADVSRSMSKEIVGNEVAILKFIISPNSEGSLIDIMLVFSTSGSNMAVPASTPTGFACDPTNPFCAFGDFETTIYSRAGGN